MVWLEPELFTRRGKAKELCRGPLVGIWLLDDNKT